MCSKCGRDLPLSRFRHIRKNQPERHSECEECRNRYRRSLTVAKRQADVRRAMTQINRAIDEAKIKAVVSALIRRCGGVVRLVELWSSEIDAQKGVDRARSLMAVGKVVAALQSNRVRSE